MRSYPSPQIIYALLLRVVFFASVFPLAGESGVPQSPFGSGTTFAVVVVGAFVVVVVVVGAVVVVGGGVVVVVVVVVGAASVVVAVVVFFSVLGA